MTQIATTTEHTSVDLDSLTIRVTKSLSRFGYPDVLVTHVGDRTIRLSGPTDSPDERALVIAIARTVPGVVDVRYSSNTISI